MKTCTKCGETKAVEEFNRHSGFRDGRNSQCRACKRRYYEANRARERERSARRRRSRTVADKAADTEYMRQRRAACQAFVDAQKERPCERCGVAYPGEPYMMDFDHVDRSAKSSSIASMVQNRRALPEIAAEIAKCQLLCVVCHRRKTHTEDYPEMRRVPTEKETL